jgi:hypothetical protein
MADHPIWRKIEVRMWGDKKFRTLSLLPPSGQSLWFFLLTGPHTGPIPGLLKSGRAAMAEELGWPQEAFDKAFEEVFSLGMAKADWEARLVWIPNAIKCNLPQSPNVIKSWTVSWQLMPECQLKLEVYDGLKSAIYGLGESFMKAFEKACVKPFLIPSPNQEADSNSRKQQGKKPAATASIANETEPADPRHALIRQLIQDLHIQKFHVTCHWDASEAKQLDRLLAANPGWNEGQLTEMVSNRFSSEGITSDRPRKWLPHLGSYAAGPQDRFGRVKGIHRNDHENRAERRQASNLAAREAARAAIMAD